LISRGVDRVAIGIVQIVRVGDTREAYDGEAKSRVARCLAQHRRQKIAAVC
jgi:hypothetical protein